MTRPRSTTLRWVGDREGFDLQRARGSDADRIIALCPFDAYAWLIPKDVLLEFVIGRMGQHTGATGTDTAWLGLKEGNPYDWRHPTATGFPMSARFWLASEEALLRPSQAVPAARAPAALRPSR